MNRSALRKPHTLRSRKTLGDAMAVASRRAISLVEVVVSLGLLAAIMLPVAGLMATSHKVFQAGQVAHDAAYVRQTALDAARIRLQGCQRVVAVASQHVDLLTAAGTTARLTFVAGRLQWSEGGAVQVLASGLTAARFNVGTAAGANVTAGSLLMIEVATQRPGEPNPHWSTTTVWIRPSI